MVGFATVATGRVSSTATANVAMASTHERRGKRHPELVHCGLVPARCADLSALAPEAHALVAGILAACTADDLCRHGLPAIQQPLLLGPRRKPSHLVAAPCSARGDDESLEATEAMGERKRREAGRQARAE